MCLVLLGMIHGVLSAGLLGTAQAGEELTAGPDIYALLRGWKSCYHMNYRCLIQSLSIIDRNTSGYLPRKNELLIKKMMVCQVVGLVLPKAINTDGL